MTLCTRNRRHTTLVIEEKRSWELDFALWATLWLIPFFMQQYQQKVHHFCSILPLDCRFFFFLSRITDAVYEIKNAPSCLPLLNKAKKEATDKHTVQSCEITMTICIWCLRYHSYLKFIHTMEQEMTNTCLNVMFFAKTTHCGMEN